MKITVETTKCYIVEITEEEKQGLSNELLNLNSEFVIPYLSSFMTALRTVDNQLGEIT